MRRGPRFRRLTLNTISDDRARMYIQGKGDPMSQVFSGPKMPALPTTPTPPTLSQASAAQSQDEIMRRRRGRASTLLTGEKGLTTPPATASKTLLGQ